MVDVYVMVKMATWGMRNRGQMGLCVQHLRAGWCMNMQNTFMIPWNVVVSHISRDNEMISGFVDVFCLHSITANEVNHTLGTRLSQLYL